MAKFGFNFVTLLATLAVFVVMLSMMLDNGNGVAAIRSAGWNSFWDEEKRSQMTEQEILRKMYGAQSRLRG